MEKYDIKAIMVPISDYATVSSEANLFEAMMALENQSKTFGSKPYRHQSVLVVDHRKRVVGKVSQVDIMAALEPNYNELGSNFYLNRIGFSMTFLKAVQEKFNLWERPVTELLQNLKNIKVADIMYTPADTQKVEETDTLETVMHQIVMGRHHSLLVTRKNKIIGILRSTDVFNQLYELIIDEN